MKIKWRENKQRRYGLFGPWDTFSWTGYCADSGMIVCIVQGRTLYRQEPDTQYFRFIDGTQAKLWAEKWYAENMS